ncbi:Cytochrome c556 [Solimonas aquatica]|uniref:Cytochrome c556 n=1 Tax=Solimonas aquatica TaxID=489703 RepID=A0A1H9DVC2_9GAMM|nr:Cytochrome c556 [Solimonas aquatica]
MTDTTVVIRRIRHAAVFLALSAGLSAAALAQSAGGPPTPAKQAIDARKAIFTLTGANFKPLGDVLGGRAGYDAAEAKKRATRVAFLTTLLPEAFPDISATGETRAKPEIWSERADFDQRLKDYLDHTEALAAAADKGEAAFKTAAAAVAQDCKGCHDKYRSK